MKRIDISKLAFLCFLGTVSAFAQSLGPDYNLGRVTGGPYASHELLTNQSSGQQMIQGMGTVSLGKESYHQFDFNGFAFYQNTPIHPTVAFVPYQISATVRPDMGHQVYAFLYSPVISYLYLNGKHTTGLEDSLASPLKFGIQWDMVTRDGHIDVRPHEYEWTFRRGPIVDGGEFRSHMVFQTKASDLAQKNTDSYTFEWSPAFGIMDGVQLGFDYGMHWNQLIDGGKPKSLTWNLETRYHQFYMLNSLSATTENNPSDLFKKDSNVWTIQGGMILGSRELRFQNVNGNWDHFFNPMLGWGQLLIEGEHEQSLDHNNHFQLATGNIFLGALPFLTFGSSIHWTYDDYESKHTYTTRLHVNLANPSVRNEGPSDVSALEYRYGFIPRMGQFVAFSNVALPFKKGNTSYTGQTNTIKTTQMLRAMSYSILSDTDPNSEDVSGNPWFQTKIRLGLTDFLFVTGELSYFSDGFSVEDTTREKALWQTLGIGAHVLPSFLAEAGVVSLKTRDQFDWGPIYLKVNHSF